MRGREHQVPALGAAKRKAELLGVEEGKEGQQETTGDRKGAETGNRKDEK